MKTRLIRIGNSRGVRLPKPMIEEAALGDHVELRVSEGAITITKASRARTGWAEAARRLGARGEDRLIEPPTATRFEDEEWTW